MEIKNTGSGFPREELLPVFFISFCSQKPRR